MAGTKAGGLKAKETIYKKHGSKFYAGIGAKGGKWHGIKGFASNTTLAKLAGSLGGRTSKRGPSGMSKGTKVRVLEAVEYKKVGYSIKEIADIMQVSTQTIRSYLSREKEARK